MKIYSGSQENIFISEYRGDGEWKITVERAQACHEGSYHCTATNCFGSDTKRWSLEMIKDLPSLSSEILDDIEIYHDDTVVSGDISDPEFIEEMVKFKKFRIKPFVFGYYIETKDCLAK